MDRLGDMRLFVDTADLGSLSAAGRKLGLSPAAASARLLKLEQQLRTKLFERTTRRLRLTEEGQLYLPHCRSALDAIGDGEAALLARQAVVRGKVRISATSDFGRNTLRGWLAAFHSRYPEVSLAVTLSDSMSNLLQDDIDLAIRFAAPLDGSLVARRLAPNRRVLCAAPAYLARRGMPASPEALVEHRFVLMANASGVMNELRLARGKKRLTYSVAADQAWETNDGALCRDWALAGQGIAHKSIWDIADDVRAGALRLVLPEWQTEDSAVHALFHRNRYMAPRVRVLLDFLLERFEAASDDVFKVLGASADGDPTA